MSTPKPGQIRCPTCHRSTAPAAYCTHCGSAIPSSAVVRPRGMDRDELDARIRSRRVETPYRRGGYADEWGDTPGGYAPFAPEPEDALAQRREAEPAAPAHVDHMADQQVDAWVPPPAPPASEPPAAADRPDPWRRGREVEEPQRVDEPEPEEPRAPGALVPPLPPLIIDPTPVQTEAEPEPLPAAPQAHPDPWAARPVEAPPPAEEPPYAATSADDDEGWPADEAYYVPADESYQRRGGGSALPIIGFGALGLLAILFGVFFSNLMGGDPAARASATPSATVSASIEATPSETAVSSGSAGPSQSGQPNASEGPPITFPDGFTATTEPCVSQPNASGCESDGATNSGSIWVYIGFNAGRRDDVLGMTILDDAGAVVAQASIELAEVNCPANVPCNGWLLFPGFGTPYTGLDPGDYTIRINRNGLPAAEADFTVT